MRQHKRIPICLKLLFKNKILHHFLNTKTTKKVESINIIHQNWELIEKEWVKYPDCRFGQLLSNLGFVDKEVENIIWNIEEDRWLIDNGYIKFEDIKFWGVNYYKNGKQRKTTKFKLLKDLDTDHIKNIIIFFEKYNSLDKLNKDYLKYFNRRINNLNK
jgi:Txe/YoeB family toxin of Txe-Axe toxin-antitoxin module